MTWNQRVVVDFGAGGEKGMGGGVGAGVEGVDVGVRRRRVLGEVMSEVSCGGDAWGRDEGSSSGSAV